MIKVALHTFTPLSLCKPVDRFLLFTDVAGAAAAAAVVLWDHPPEIFRHTKHGLCCTFSLSVTTNRLIGQGHVSRVWKVCSLLLFPYLNTSLPLFCHTRNMSMFCICTKVTLLFIVLHFLVFIYKT